MRTMGYMPTEMELTELGQQIRMNCEAGGGNGRNEWGQGWAKRGIRKDLEVESKVGDKGEGKRA